MKNLLAPASPRTSCLSYLLFLSLLTLSPRALLSQVRLSEIAPTNTGQVEDEDGDRPDWIEIRNGGTQVANFFGWGVGDGAKSARWLLPDVNVGPGERLLVFASGKNRGSVTPLPGSIHHWETALHEGDEWHYFIGTSQPPSDWNTLGFDDSGWAIGPGGFGYGDSDDATSVPAGTPSVYYRHAFGVADASLLAGAVLSMDYDDGFIAYLNGQEIARSGTVVGQPAWNTLVGEHEATFYNSAALPEAYSFDQAALAALLLPGQNVLAVELHNTSLNSSDLSGRTWLHFGVTENVLFWGPTPPWFTPGGTQSGGNLHTDFKINFSEKIELYDELGNLVDSVTMQQLQAGHSLMRINDDGDWCIGPGPTPGAANGFDCENGYAAPPAFALAAGFYSGNQNVSITGGGEIRYTDDGSEPDTNSPLYSGPILVTQNTVLRARRFEQFKLPSAVATATYFINEDVTLPVVSVTIPPIDFSEVYDDYARKGIVGVEFFDKNKQKQFDGKFAGYVVGNWSVSFPQKSLQFDADEDYGSVGEIEYPIFPEKPIAHYRSFRIRNEDDDWNQARMRDRIVNELAAPTHAGRASYSNVIGFINGQYWGHYVARERLDNYFARDNYGADPDSVNMVKTHYGLDPYLAEYGTIDDFYAMADFISNNDMADDANFQQAATLLDLENFTDYFETEIYVASTDWLQDYFNNFRLFKTGKNDPWKFLLWDVSYSAGTPNAGSTSPDSDVLGNTLGNSSRYAEMLRGLLANPAYRRYFINRFADLMNTHFLPARAHALVDVNAAELGPEIQRHHERWGTGDFAFWSGAVQVLRDFYAERPANQRQHIIDNFQLDGEVSITLAASPPGAGTVKISTVVPQSLPWTGIYFHGNPVTVTAIANPGYAFINWSANPNIGNLAAKSFTADVPGNTTCTANFVGTPQPVALKISEVNYNSDPSRNAGDWLEIRNVGSSLLDLSDFSVGDKDWFHRFTMPTGTSIAPGGHLVLFENEGEFFSENPTVQNTLGPLTFHLDNNGDELHLFDRAGAEVAAAAYQDAKPWPCAPDGFGGTLERSDANNDPALPESWFTGCVGGSPGAVFSPCEETPIVTEINYKSAAGADAGDWVELFNRSANPLDLAGWQIGDGNGNVFDIPAGTILPPSGFHVFFQDAAKFTAQFPAVTNKTGPLGFGLNGNGDMLRLWSPDGRAYLSLCYDDAAPWPNEPDGNGYTLENEDIGGNLNDVGNWFAGCAGGSPGQAFDPNCGSVGTEEGVALSSALRVWPNPASEVLYFSLEGGNMASVVLKDVLGRDVMPAFAPSFGEPSAGKEATAGKKEGFFPITNLPCGVYVVEARTGSAVFSPRQMVVIQR